jgi:hypothetical protein
MHNEDQTDTLDDWTYMRFGVAGRDRSCNRQR